MDEQEQKIKANIVLEIVGKPKEHVEESFQYYLKQIQEHQEYIVKNENLKDASEIEKGLFSIFGELQIEFKDVQSIFSFAMDYMPASIEIEEPAKLVYTRNIATNIVNDMLGKLHRVDMVAKQSAQNSQLMAQSMGILAQNAILILLNLGPKNKENIAKYVGIQVDQIDKFLDKLIEDKKIEKTGEKYKLLKNGSETKD